MTPPATCRPTSTGRPSPRPRRSSSCTWRSSTWARSRRHCMAGGRAGRRSRHHRLQRLHAAPAGGRDDARRGRGLRRDERSAHPGHRGGRPCRRLARHARLVQGPRCGRTRLAKAIVDRRPIIRQRQDGGHPWPAARLRNRGLRVASAKVGPDYIDPRFHEAATGRPCFNLDPWAMSDGTDRTASLSESRRDADLVIIEGRHGPVRRPAWRERFDRRPRPHASGLPVLLAVDCRHQAPVHRRPGPRLRHATARTSRWQA